MEVKFSSAVPVERAALHFTTGANKWNEREWHTVEAEVQGSTVKAELRERRPIVHFVTLTDSRKAMVSTEHQVVEG